jgi:hypothetical protein
MDTREETNTHIANMMLRLNLPRLDHQRSVPSVWPIDVEKRTQKNIELMSRKEKQEKHQLHDDLPSPRTPT